MLTIMRMLMRLTMDDVGVDADDVDGDDDEVGKGNHYDCDDGIDDMRWC